jgi:hypothetical protein
LQRYLSRYPNILPAHLMMAAVYSELGQAAEARAEAAEVLRLNPNFSLDVHKQREPIKDPAVLERHIAALRKAGLKWTMNDECGMMNEKQVLSKKEEICSVFCSQPAFEDQLLGRWRPDKETVVEFFSMASGTMTREEILQSLHALESQLRTFEEQYRLRSDDFYRLVQDGRVEQSADFIEWLGLYEIKCKREQQYRRLTDALLSPLLRTEPAAEKKLVLPLVESA